MYLTKLFIAFSCANSKSFQFTHSPSQSREWPYVRNVYGVNPEREPENLSQEPTQ
ncbi:hypothetical protein SAMN05444003_0780 [Cognatiyoonia sediminum]|uniref:Uncharacterized protein n=1 Tax=Cognatiyoonia sediminum TaxID=1508389 RepID=A0A1M5MDV7_9RHOB|nr:hypothetical protein SAMN05444003_0780 [Cognatiyoonia sediminum]